MEDKPVLQLDFLQVVRDEGAMQEKGLILLCYFHLPMNFLPELPHADPGG